MGPIGIAFILSGRWSGVESGGLSPGAAKGLVAFTLAVALVTVALWPDGPASSSPLGAPPETSQGETVAPVAPTPRIPASQSVVGKEPYSGPVTAQETVAACAPAKGAAALDCYTEKLKALLVGKGAIAAFDALSNLTTVDPGVSGQGHALAHVLGRYAFFAYGSIQEALANCSDKVFQGCFHGALEAYFEALPDLQPSDVDVCVEKDAFRKSTCIHGIGHGLMLYTNANVNASLGNCDLLSGNYDQSSCWSGVFMENLVGYYESKGGAAHHHGNLTAPPGYMVVRAGDPYFPCSVVAPKYQDSCWVQAADYILFANASDWEDAAQKCDAAPVAHRPACRQRLGTDASGWYRDVPKAVHYCSYGDASGRADCIKGIAEEVVLYYYSPQAGIDACKQVPVEDKGVCYRQVPVQGTAMVGGKERMAPICDTAEAGYVNDCRAATGLAPVS